MNPTLSSSSSLAAPKQGEGGSSILDRGSFGNVPRRSVKSQITNRKSKIFTSLFLLPFTFFLLTASAQSTNDSSTTSDFSTFQIIVDRNIFNPDRYGRMPRTHYEQRGVPTFSLAGTMSYRKGMFAFFNGTSDEYRKAMQQGGKIAGYTVGKIGFESVQLQSSGITIEMKVGAAMRLEGGKWELSAPGEWGEIATSETTTGSGAQETSETSSNQPSSGGGSDVLQRLMEKRKQQEQELK